MRKVRVERWSQLSGGDISSDSSSTIAESAPDPATSPLAEGPAGSSPVELEETAVGGGAAVPLDKSEEDKLNCPRK